MANYDKAIGLRPDNLEALTNRGLALQELKRFDEAVASHNKAIALKPDFSEALNNRGNVFQEMKRFEEALASYDQAVGLKPDCGVLNGPVELLLPHPCRENQDKNANP